MIKALAQGAEKEARKAVEKTKALVRAFVEHPFHIVKNLLRHRQVRYRGLAKNGHQLHTLSGLANVMIGARTWAGAGEKQPLAPVAEVSPAVDPCGPAGKQPPNQVDASAPTPLIIIFLPPPPPI